MSCRATRSGAVFSPYDAPPLPSIPHKADLLWCEVDLEAAVRAAIARSDQRAAREDSLPGRSYVVLDNDGRPLADVDDEEDSWDDEPEETRSDSESSASSCPSTTAPPSRSPSPAPSSSAPLPAAPAPDHAPGVHRRRQNDASKARRSRRRQRAADGAPYSRQPNHPRSQKHRELSPDRVSFDAADVPASGGGAWTGRRSSPSIGGGAGRRRAGRRIYTLPELLAAGCRLVRWNGRDPKLILDARGRIVAILLGTPEDPDWDAVIADAVEEMSRARRRCLRHGVYHTAFPLHRRGRYVPISMGASLGGGQRRPGNLFHGPALKRIARRVRRNPNIKRVMGFQSSGLAAYAPKLHHYMRTTLKGVFQRHPYLKQNWSNSIYPAATFNCGPAAVCFRHRDCRNLSHSFCAITSGGRFDYTLGGHIYLRQLGLVIEFPSGATILIPSGCVDHGNTPIQKNETRYSMTQYAAGALFRWAAYGYQSAKSLLSKPGGAQAKQSFDGEPGSRWQWALGLFSKHDELEADRAAVFGNV